MKTFKKILSLILLTLLVCMFVFAATSCGKKKNKPEPKEDVPSYMTIHEDDVTITHAAYELSAYSMKSTGCPVNAYTPAAWATLDNLELTPVADIIIYLGTSEWFSLYYPELMMDLYANSLVYDGFVIAPVEGGIAVMSNYNRGVLYGVYDILKTNGFCFYSYLEGYEYIPSLSFIRLTDKIVVKNPSFEIRSIEYSGSAADYIEETDYIKMLSWAAKNGINEMVSDVFSTYVGVALANYGFASLRGKTVVVDRDNPANGVICREHTNLEQLGYRLSDRSAEISDDLKAFNTVGVKGVTFAIEKNVTGYMFDSDIYCLANGMWNIDGDLSEYAESLFNFKYKDTGVEFDAYTNAARAENSALKAEVDELYATVSQSNYTVPALIAGNEMAKLQLSALYAEYKTASDAEKPAKYENIEQLLAAVDYFKI